MFPSPAQTRERGVFTSFRSSTRAAVFWTGLEVLGGVSCGLRALAADKELIAVLLDAPAEDLQLLQFDSQVLEQNNGPIVELFLRLAIRSQKEMAETTIDSYRPAKALNNLN